MFDTDTNRGMAHEGDKRNDDKGNEGNKGGNNKGNKCDNNEVTRTTRTTRTTNAVMIMRVTTMRVTMTGTVRVALMKVSTTAQQGGQQR